MRCVGYQFPLVDARFRLNPQVSKSPRSGLIIRRSQVQVLRCPPIYLRVRGGISRWANLGRMRSALAEELEPLPAAGQHPAPAIQDTRAIR